MSLPSSLIHVRGAWLAWGRAVPIRWRQREAADMVAWVAEARLGDGSMRYANTHAWDPSWRDLVRHWERRAPKKQRRRRERVR